MLEKASNSLKNPDITGPGDKIPGPGTTKLLFFWGWIWLHFSIATPNGQKKLRLISTTVLVFCEHERRNVRSNNRGYLRNLAKKTMHKGKCNYSGQYFINTIIIPEKR